MSNKKSHTPRPIKDEDLSNIEGMLQKLDIMVGVDDKTSATPSRFIQQPKKQSVSGEAGPSLSEQDALQHPLHEIDCLDQFEDLDSSMALFQKIEFFLPDESGKSFSLDLLRKFSIKNTQFFQAAAINTKVLPKVQAFAFLPGQIIARSSPFDPGNHSDNFSTEWLTEQLEPGPYVTMSSDGEYSADRYGYLSLIGNKLSIVPPLFIDREKLHVHWGIFMEEAHGVTFQMVRQWVEDLGITAPLNIKKINQLISLLAKGHHEKGAYLIASGKKPIHGKDAEVEFLVPMERPGGIERPDGSIDFREVHYIPNVEEEQCVVRRTPPVQGISGFDVMGHKIPAKKHKDIPLTAKSNVLVKNEGDTELYYATCSGALSFDNGLLSVIKILTLTEGVNYKTGNIYFAGSVFVNGTVMEGFSVKAEDDITISETVSEGAEVISQNGSITIGRGVIGTRTKVVALGFVRAQFVHDAGIRAGNKIIIGNYCYNASLFTNGSIVVHKGTGTRGGSISGGQAVALNGIDLWSAGSQSWIPTELVAAFNPEIMDKRERIEAAIAQSSKHINRILNFFNISRIEPDIIRTQITQATGSKKKVFSQQAKLLGQTAKSYKALLEMRLALKKEAEEEKTREATIRVRTNAYPGVTIRIGHQSLRLNHESKAVVFKQGKNSIEAQ